MRARPAPTPGRLSAALRLGEQLFFLLGDVFFLGGKLLGPLDELAQLVCGDVIGVGRIAHLGLMHIRGDGLAIPYPATWVGFKRSLPLDRLAAVG